RFRPHVVRRRRAIQQTLDPMVIRSTPRSNGRDIGAPVSASGSDSAAAAAMVKASAPEVDGSELAAPEYAAANECGPAAGLVMVIVAVPPVTATVPSGVAPSVKVTL